MLSISRRIIASTRRVVSGINNNNNNAVKSHLLSRSSISADFSNVAWGTSSSYHTSSVSSSNRNFWNLPSSSRHFSLPHQQKRMLSVSTEILETLGDTIVMGAPLGAGKPNTLINALYQRAKESPHISLTICTALTLEKPKAKNELEKEIYSPVLLKRDYEYFLKKLSFTKDEFEAIMSAKPCRHDAYASDKVYIDPLKKIGKIIYKILKLKQ